MFGIINFESFLIAGLILNLTPGADTMYILGRSIAQGKKAGVLSALGISTGAIFHIIFATLGLSIILAKSATAFEIVKYLGAAYLIFLGLKTIFKKADGKFELSNENEIVNYKKIYFSGVLTNILNPKVALFFLAFLPQFIDPNYVQSSLPFLILGITFLLTGTIWCLVLALFASKLSDRIRKNYGSVTECMLVLSSVFLPNIGFNKSKMHIIFFGKTNSLATKSFGMSSEIKILSLNFLCFSL